MQRFFDIFFSFLALLVLSPLFIPIIIILRVTGEGEIFYIQERSGKEGKHFGLYKFATMLRDSPNMGAGEITLKSDPRVLKFGKYLRKTKLNELPQLINILFGEMSIVGPRPMVPNTYLKYPLEAQKKINTVRPGLTGIGSIIFRDEETFLDTKDDPRKFYDDVIIPYKSNLEIWYVENKTFTIYLKIIFITACAVIFPSYRGFDSYFKDLPKLPDDLT
tara:strand:+ start:4026 stop:4682 length:657 start_codon:yes stop_codon:yes gene_type:complete